MDKYEKVEQIVNRMIDNGVIPMSDEDYSICRFISDNLDNIPLIKFKDNILDVNQMCKKSINSFTIYEDKLLLERIINILKRIRINDDNTSSNISSFKSNIDTSNKDINNCFIPHSITVPGIFNDLAPLYFSHEMHHILKDTNPSEYKYMLLYADVIPMFFELVQSGLYDDTSKKAIINTRLALISDLKRFIDIHDSRDEKNYITNIIDSKRCQYLNSFYYSIMLYKLYKSNPHGVLNIVKKVLMGEITTDTLIYIFGLCDRIHDNDVIDEINKIKRK